MSVQFSAIEPQNPLPIKSDTPERQKLEQLTDAIINAPNFRMTPEFLNELEKVLKDVHHNAHTISHQSLCNLLENKELRNFLENQHTRFFEIEQSINGLHKSRVNTYYTAKKMSKLIVLTLLTAVFCAFLAALFSSPLTLSLLTVTVVASVALLIIHDIIMVNKYKNLNNAITSLQDEQNILGVVKSEEKTLSLDELKNSNTQQPQNKNYSYQGKVESFSRNGQTFYSIILPKSNVSSIENQPASATPSTVNG